MEGILPISEGRDKGKGNRREREVTLVGTTTKEKVGSSRSKISSGVKLAPLGKRMLLLTHVE